MSPVALRSLVSSRFVFSWPCWVLALLLAGCQQKATEQSAAEVVVNVAQPVRQKVTEFEDFVGRTDAVESVDVRARVSGYLDKVAFISGDPVKKGDLLFQIDPRPYQADLDRAKADVAQTKAKLQRAAADLARAEKLRPNNVISAEEYDKIVADHATAVAAVAQAEATLERSQLNLDFTRVASPIDGISNRNQITVGNLVVADQTLLTTIVSRDPVYAYFDIDERTMLRFQRQAQAENKDNNVPPLRERKVPVFLALADETDFPHPGTLDFAENRLDSGTGTLRVRGLFPNHNDQLRPGEFVRVRLPLSEPHEAILVPERAIASNQGLKYLLVVNAQNIVENRPVELGSAHGEMRVIESGITAEDWVIVNGIMRVRPGMKVKPNRADASAPAKPAPAESK